MQVKLAIVAPVVNPTPALPGSPSASSTQRSVTASTAAAAGELTRLNAFWSQALTSQSAASAAGRAPPVTKPK